MTSKEESAPQPVGLIGVGLVGSAIADRLGEAGVEVAGYDLVPTANPHVVCCESARAVCRRCSTVILSLPTSAVVAEVLRDVLSTLTPEHLLIDTTTGDPEDTESHVAALARSGAAYLEATVAGSSELLREGKATLFLGGQPSDVERSRWILELFGGRYTRLGPVGAGSRFKLVFNLLLGLQRAALAEALHFGEALGFDPAVALDILALSPASSAVLASKGGKMVERHYDPPQARLAQHLKDVRIILAAAARAGAEVPLSETHRELLERAESLGFGALDNAAVREAFPLTRREGES